MDSGAGVGAFVIHNSLNALLHAPGVRVVVEVVLNSIYVVMFGCSDVLFEVRSGSALGLTLFRLLILHHGLSAAARPQCSSRASGSERSELIFFVVMASV